MLPHKPRFIYKISLLVFAFLILGSNGQSFAVIDMSTKAVNAALVYGMKNQKLGISNLLGANWVENADGALLNVYTPFMMLATKASRAKLPQNPAPSDLDRARKHFARDVAFYSDPNNRIMVKFSVSFYGDSPSFAKYYSARIEGIGRGQNYTLKPEKQLLDQVADPLGIETPPSASMEKAKKEINMSQPSTGATGLPYSAETEASDKAFAERLAELRGDKKAESDQQKKKAVEEKPTQRGQHDLYAAINSYYFPLRTLVDLDEFQLILESPKGKPVTFRLNNAKLY
jgi:hypothetical protein